MARSPSIPDSRDSTNSPACEDDEDASLRVKMEADADEANGTREDDTPQEGTPEPELAKGDGEGAAEEMDERPPNSPTPSPTAPRLAKRAALDEDDEEVETEMRRKLRKTSARGDEPSAPASSGKDVNGQRLPLWAPTCTRCFTGRIRCDRNADQPVCSQCVDREIECVPGPIPNNPPKYARGYVAPRISGAAPTADAPTTRRRSAVDDSAATGKGKGKAKAKPSAAATSAAKWPGKTVTYARARSGKFATSAPPSPVKGKSAAKGPPLRRASAPEPKAKARLPATAAKASTSKSAPAKVCASTSKARSTKAPARTTAKAPPKPSAASSVPAKAARSTSPTKPKASASVPRRAASPAKRPSVAASKQSDALADWIVEHIDDDAEPFVAALGAAGISSLHQITALRPSELAELVTMKEITSHLTAVQRILLKSRAVPHLEDEEL